MVNYEDLRGVLGRKIEFPVECLKPIERFSKNPILFWNEAYVKKRFKSNIHLYDKHKQEIQYKK